MNNKLKKWLIILFLSFSGYISLAQTYSKSVTVKDFGTWDKVVSPANKISISSYITKQKIFVKGVGQNPVPESPKYRYELVLKSNSIYNGSLTKTWIYGAKVFIDSLEVTRNQSPDGFTAIINIEPTIVYRYDSNLDTINIKISWKGSQYLQNR